jgi:hypothetical protein
MSLFPAQEHFAETLVPYTKLMPAEDQMLNHQDMSLGFLLLICSSSGELCSVRKFTSHVAVLLCFLCQMIDALLRVNIEYSI